MGACISSQTTIPQKPPIIFTEDDIILVYSTIFDIVAASAFDLISCGLLTVQHTHPPSLELLRGLCAMAGFNIAISRMQDPFGSLCISKEVQIDSTSIPPQLSGALSVLIHCKDIWWKAASEVHPTEDEILTLKLQIISTTISPRNFVPLLRFSELVEQLWIFAEVVENLPEYVYWRDLTAVRIGSGNNSIRDSFFWCKNSTADAVMNFKDSVEPFNLVLNKHNNVVCGASYAADDLLCEDTDDEDFI